MDNTRLLDLGPRIQWELEGRGNHVDRQWESSRSNVLALTELAAPMRRVKQHCPPPWWMGTITSAKKENQGFHEICGHSWQSRPLEERSGEKVAVTHPSAMPDCLRGASLGLPKATPQPTPALCNPKQDYGRPWVECKLPKNQVEQPHDSRPFARIFPGCILAVCKGTPRKATL